MKMHFFFQLFESDMLIVSIIYFKQYKGKDILVFKPHALIVLKCEEKKS